MEAQFSRPTQDHSFRRDGWMPLFSLSIVRDYLFGKRRLEALLAGESLDQFVDRNSQDKEKACDDQTNFVFHSHEV